MAPGANKGDGVVCQIQDLQAGGRGKLGVQSLDHAVFAKVLQTGEASVNGAAKAADMNESLRCGEGRIDDRHGSQQSTEAIDALSDGWGKEVREGRQW
jgi:hypothetical protein